MQNALLNTRSVYSSFPIGFLYTQLPEYMPSFERTFTDHSQDKILSYRLLHHLLPRDAT